MKPLHFVAVIVLIIAAMFYHSTMTISDSRPADISQVMTPTLRDTAAQTGPVADSSIPDVAGANAAPLAEPTQREDPVADKPDSEEAQLRQSILTAESADDLEALFLTSQGMSNGALESVLRNPTTFEALLEMLSSVGAGTFANNRADRLHYIMYNEVSSYIYAEDYACAGKLCAVRFTSPEADTSQFRVFREFGDDYFFTSTLENSNGDTNYEMLFFAKDNMADSLPQMKTN